MIPLTDNAVASLAELQLANPDQNLRICGSFSDQNTLTLTVDLSPAARQNDIEIQLCGFNVYLDPLMSLALVDAAIDFDPTDSTYRPLHLSSPRPTQTRSSL